jgi:hypothetical protein
MLINFHSLKKFLKGNDFLEFSKFREQIATAGTLIV